MSRLLVAEDSTTQTQQIRLILEEVGFEVETVPNGLEALQAIERTMPALVVTDLEMPKMNGLELVEAIRKRYPALPVVLMTAYGSEEIASTALRKGASSYVPKRFLNDDLIPTIENILAVIQAERNNQRVLDCLRETEVYFVLDNDDSLIPLLIGQMEELVTRVQLCDQTGLIQVCVALREALINAVEHGNLEASSDVYEKDEKEYRALVTQRRQQEPYGQRRIFFNAKVSRSRAEFIVRDEGQGYDPAGLPDPTDPSNLEKMRGRGLLLIRTFMDEIYHNESGNEITMVKRGDR